MPISVLSSVTVEKASRGGMYWHEHLICSHFHTEYITSIKVTFSLDISDNAPYISMEELIKMVKALEEVSRQLQWEPIKNQAIAQRK